MKNEPLKRIILSIVNSDFSCLIIFLSYKYLYLFSIHCIITYACPIWGNCASSHIKKMQSVQNKVLRIIANAPWFVRMQISTKAFKSKKSKIILKHSQKTSTALFQTLQAQFTITFSLTRLVVD